MRMTIECKCQNGDNNDIDDLVSAMLRRPCNTNEDNDDNDYND